MTRLPRFSLVEVAAISLFIVVATTLVIQYTDPWESEQWRFRSRYPHEEWLKLEAKYGPHYYSIGVDEWIIRDALQDRRDGTFVDVGASHYRLGSNTFYLEQHLGWSGLAIEPRTEFAPDYAQHRPRTKFVAMFASDRADAKAQLFVPASNLFVASRTKEEAVKESGGETVTAREVPTTTLNAALEQAGIERIDFLNMDIEGAEPLALAGFDIDRYRPQLVCIEAHLGERQFILDYFADHAYDLIGKYLRVDPTNLYFMPRRRAPRAK